MLMFLRKYPNFIINFLSYIYILYIYFLIILGFMNLFLFGEKNNNNNAMVVSFYVVFMDLVYKIF